MNQRPISQLQPGDTDSAAAHTPARSHRRTVLTETSPLRHLAAFGLWTLRIAWCHRWRRRGWQELMEADDVSRLSDWWLASSGLSDWLLLQFHKRPRFSGPPLLQGRTQTRLYTTTLYTLGFYTWGHEGRWAWYSVSRVWFPVRRTVCVIEGVFNCLTHSQAHNDHCWVLPLLNAAVRCFEQTVWIFFFSQM